MGADVINSLKVNCSTSNLKAIRKFVDESLKAIEVSDYDTSLIILAVDEVCSNLIIHSNLENDEEVLTLFIKLERQGEDIVFEIIDYGIAFNYSDYKEPNIDDLIKEKRRGSIGLMLVRRIMDRIEFKTEDNHNVCRLYKRLPNQKVA